MLATQVPLTWVFASLLTESNEELDEITAAASEVELEVEGEMEGEFEDTVNSNTRINCIYLQTQVLIDGICNDDDDDDDDDETIPDAAHAVCDGSTAIIVFVLFS
jgi:hypothetical protein